MPSIGLHFALTLFLLAACVKDDELKPRVARDFDIRSAHVLLKIPRTFFKFFISKTALKKIAR